jgi:glc operon protein GlcG
MIIRTLALALVLVAPSAPAVAQTPRPQLDLATARKMEAACLAYATEKNFKIAIAIYDYAGRMISFAQMDGTPTAIADIAQWKGKSAATIQISTEETAKWTVQGVPGIAYAGGGLPLFDASWNALGGIGISGAPVEEDIACGKAAIAASGIAQPK